MTAARCDLCLIITQLISVKHKHCSREVIMHTAGMLNDKPSLNNACAKTFVFHVCAWVGWKSTVVFAAFWSTSTMIVSKRNGSVDHPCSCLILGRHAVLSWLHTESNKASCTSYMFAQVHHLPELLKLDEGGSRLEFVAVQSFAIVNCCATFCVMSTLWWQDSYKLQFLILPRCLLQKVVGLLDWLSYNYEDHFFIFWSL